MKLAAAIQRTPFVIEEAEENEELGESHGPKTQTKFNSQSISAVKAAAADDGEGSEDFSFDVPDKL